MAGLPPGDPQLVSMIVNHLKTQGLFDQFRRDCLADVDTKPAYLNLRQRVDNFVSNHLSNHTWSPHLNKNQLRNNIRQLVLQSGMLEQGVDRIVAQVVDPKIHHIFRPQVEKVVRQFLSPGSHVEEPSVYYPPGEDRQDLSLPQSVVGSAPGTSANAMSILDTISSLNQEASSRTDIERYQKDDLVAEEAVLRAAEEAALKDNEEAVLNGSTGEQDMSLVEEEEESEAAEKLPEEDEKATADVSSSEIKTEDMSEEMDIDRESVGQDMKVEEEEKENQAGEEREVKEEEGKDRSMSRSPAKAAEETPSKDQDTSKTINEKQRIRQKARERLKEEYSLEDSDLEGLSDITVSSVHTSDLSSFEGESDDEPQPSDSTEEGEITSEDEKAEKKKASSEDGEENKERKPGARRQGYVHKPFLYSRYYSDSDDEVTVEQRRRSAAKDKEERLLKRQQNRERLEEKRRTKQSQVEEQDEKKAADDTQRPRAKEACKEKKVLEKKVALSRKRKRDSRKEGDTGNKKKGDAEGDDMKKDESQKVGVSKSLASKSHRRVSESLLLDDAHRRKSGSISEEPSEPRKLVDKNRTHSFILDLEQGSEELFRQRSSSKFDRHSRKDQQLKERKEKERDRSVSDESAKLKQKAEKKAEMHGDESSQKEGAEAKVAAEDKGEKKSSKLKVEKKTSVGREVRPSVSEGFAAEEGHRDAGPKKTKASMTEAPKDKEKEKERSKGDKTAGKIDPRQSLPHPDSTGSSEERSDLEQGSEGHRKKEKLIKEVLKRSKSVTEVKHAEKHRPRHDSKDSDKDKVKGAYGSPERPPLSKSVSESDGEPRRCRDVEPGSKGKMLEKSRSKSREDPKSPVLFKPDKKVSTQDTKSKSAAPVSKADLAKEKRKEGSSKEEKKASEEHSSDKPQDTKGTRKPSERKAKDTEKKGEAQGERKGSKAVDAFLGSPISPTTPETPVSGKASQLKESSMEAEPTVSADTNTVISSVTVSDDAFDALSDITPEPEGDDIAALLGECEDEEVVQKKEEPRPVPAEADALLSLMEVCSSAERNVVAEPEPRQEVTPSAELSLQEADMKMKEAALTLLSMDPDMTLSPSLIDSHMAPVATEAVTPPEEVVTPSLELASEESMVDTSGSVQEVESGQPSKEMPADQHIPGEDVSDSVASPVEALVVTQEEVVLKDAAEEHGEAERSAAVEPTSITSSLQAMEVDTVVDQNDQSSQAPSAAVKPDENKLRGRRKRVSSLTLASPSETGSASTVPDVPEVTEVPQPHSTETENENEGPSSDKQGEIPDESTVPETEEAQTKGDAGKQEEILQETSVSPDEAPQKVPEAEDKPEKVEVTRGTRRGRQARLVKQSSSASQSDGQDEERGSDVSEMDEKSEGRVTRRGRRSAAAAVKDSSGKPKAEKEASSDQSSEPQVEETETAKATESEAPRRGRSSKAAALSPESHQEEQAAEEGHKEPEKVEEPVGRRGRRSGAQPKDTTAGRASLKRKRSEETEDSGEEVPAEETKNSGTEPSSGQPSQEGTGASSQSEEQQGEGKQETSAEMKSDHGEESGDKPQKKTPRRGRPSKAAAAAAATSTDDTDKASLEKKAKKDDEQESEQKDDQEQQEDEEEEDGGDEEKEAKPRATRSAARLEAEKNKPSKPSTRALSKVKEDSTPNTRGAKGQTTTAAKGGRKREASPPAPRTRGGQKSEETPAKRAKR